MKRSKLFYFLPLVIGAMSLAACGGGKAEKVSVEFVGENCTANHEASYDKNKDISFVITAKDGYILPDAPDKVTLGNEAVTDFTNVYTLKEDKKSADFKIKLTGNLVVTIKAKLNHTHKFSLVEGQDATCLVDGWKDYYKCETCDTYAADAEGKTIIPDIEAWKVGDGKIAATGHRFGGDITYTWEDDECTASWDCQNEGCDAKQTEVANLDNGKTEYKQDTAPTCENDGKGHYEATFTIAEFNVSDERKTAENSVTDEGSALNHDFDAPTYNWDTTQKDKCTASATCKRAGCGKTVTEDATLDNGKTTYAQDTAPTCTEDGKGHYHAEFDDEGFEDQNTAENSVIDEGSATGHKMSDPTYVWNDDECTAETHCTHTGCTEKATETVTGSYVEDTAPTCGVDGKGHYHAEFTNESFEDQDTAPNSVTDEGSALEHTMSNPTYDWDDDECTAETHCTREGCTHKITETVTGVYAKDTDATCTSNEKGHFTATFTKSEFTTQSTDANSYEKPNSFAPHQFDSTTHKCSVCKHYDVANTGVLRDATLYTTDESCAGVDKAPGFAEVHKYTDIIHCSVAGKTLFNTSVTLDDYQEIKFAIKVKDNANPTYFRAMYNGAWYQTPNATKGDWVIITASRCDTSTGTPDYSTWTLTSSVGDFKKGEDSLKVTATSSTKFNDVINILYSNGTVDIDDNFYMSEILGLKLCEFGHTKGTHHDAVEANCDHGGNVEYWDCTVCGAALDSDSHVIANPFTPITGEHDYNDDGFCTKCSVQKFNYDDIKASANVTYIENTSADKLPSFAKVYDATSNMPTNPEWGFLKSAYDFGALNYTKLSFGVKINDAGDPADTFGFQNKNYIYYYIEDHNYNWVTVNIEKVDSNFILTVDGAKIRENGKEIVDSVTLAGTTFRDIGLRTSDISTLQITEIKGYFAGDHVHDFDENLYCEECGQYLLSYTKTDGSYPTTTVLQNPDNISATTINGPEDFGKFYKYTGTTGGGTSGGFFAHTGLDSLGIKTTWESFKFSIYNTSAVNARINTAKIDDIGQAATQKAIGSGFVKVEFKLEDVSGTKYWNLYLNGVAQNLYYNRSNTMFAIFQILTDSASGFYITETTYKVAQS